MPSTSKVVIVASSINADLSIRVQNFAAPGETVRGDDAQYSLGGKGANSAVAASKCGCASAVYMVGAVGHDGEKWKNNLSAFGVDVSYVHTLSDVCTGVAVVVVNAHGENLIVLSPAANARFRTETMPESFFDILPNAVIVLHLEIDYIVAQEIAVRTKKAGGIVILNPSPIPTPGSPLYKETASIWSNIDYLIVNRLEAQALTEVSTSAEDAAIAVAKRCANCKAVIVTQGADDILLVDASDRTACKRVPVFKPSVVNDTTGAGDTVTGYVAAKLASGASLADALVFATAAAAICVERPGAAAAIPDALEVRRRLGQWGTSTGNQAQPP